MIENFLIPVYIVLGILFFLALFLFFQILKLKKRLNIFFKNENKDLEALLRTLVEKSEAQEQDIQKVFRKILKLEKTSQISFQKVGIVRYNPFKDVGGDQSFSIALLDAQNSGFIITSLYMREEVRIFTKPIIQEKSQYSLSEEEQKAIEKAIKS